MRTPLRWSLLREEAEVDRAEAPDGAENMARDDALVRSLGAPERSGEGVLRFYRWGRPTLSFGRNEPAAPYGDPERLAQAGLDVVRRPTGGRAVLHDRELTYSVVAPIASFDSLRTAYREINEALIAGLRRLGVEATASSSSAPTGVDAGPCFRAPAESEVVLHGRKLVGSAQVRVGRHLLQHGSILLRDDQLRLAELRGENPDPADRPATLSEALDPLPDIPALVTALAEGFEERLGGDWRPATTSDSFPSSLLTERRRHYRSPEWTWRRR